MPLELKEERNPKRRNGMQICRPPQATRCRIRVELGTMACHWPIQSMINHASNGAPHGLPRGAARDVMLNRGERPEIGRSFSSTTTFCIVKAGFAARVINPLFRARSTLTLLLAGEDPQFLTPSPTGHPTPPRLDPPLATTQSHSEAGGRGPVHIQACRQSVPARPGCVHAWDVGMSTA